MNILKKETKPVEVKLVEVNKSKNHPEGYDFSKVGDIGSLRVSRNGKDKKIAKQLAELLQFVKDNKIVSISRKDFYNKINVINTESDAIKRVKYKELYTQLEKSVQTIQAVSNYYWTVGDTKQVGVVAVNVA